MNFFRDYNNPVASPELIKWMEATKTAIIHCIGKEMAELLCVKDPVTFNHQLRAGACLMAVATDVGRQDIAQILGEIGGLHDVGKIINSDINRLIHLPGTLTPAQRKLVDTHPRVGADFLSAINVPVLHRLAAYYHHASADELKKVHHQAPFLGEVCMALQVADKIEAMTDISGRPYLRSRLPEEGLAYLDEAGQLHLDIKAIMQKIIDDFPSAFPTLGFTAKDIVVKMTELKILGE